MGDDALKLFWLRLQSPQRLRFRSQSRPPSQMHWHHHGQGHLRRTFAGEALVFDENFQLENGRCCHDRKRWFWRAESLQLEHWREESYLPVATLRPRGKALYGEVPHFCGSDVYQFRLSFWGQALRLSIQIQGSRKHEILIYDYYD